MNWKSLIEENGHVTIPEGVPSKVKTITDNL